MICSYRVRNDRAFDLGTTSVSRLYAMLLHRPGEKGYVNCVILKIFTSNPAST